MSSRDKRAIWRGKCLNHEHHTNGAGLNHQHGANGKYISTAQTRLLLREALSEGACQTWDSGYRARMLAASLTLARPDRFDVRCHGLDLGGNQSGVASTPRLQRG